MKKLRRRPRGFALIAALMLMSLMAIIAIAVLSRAASDRRRAVRLVRTEARENCAHAGLTYARTYFAANFDNWATYFANPQIYTPMVLPATNGGWGTSPSNVKADLSTASAIAAIKGESIANPVVGADLFLDLDSDGADDVYVFIRDNYDEFPPAAVDYKRDNDQVAIVGAVCISSTMTPKREDNTLDTDRLVVESYVTVNTASGGYTGQSGGGSSQTGNLNDT